MYMGELFHIEAPRHSAGEPSRTFEALGLVGESPVMKRLFELVHKVATTDTNVLITGETGVGKEGLARAVHLLSLRGTRPFVALNCSTLSESLIESQLFGHVRGAFTGATRASPGLFQQAEGGTIFLDEVGELPLPLQPKLLRVLQERELLPVGSTTARRVNVRVVAATNRKLVAESRAGQFREDLYYRLGTLHLAVPPLRERVDDIPRLTDVLIRRHNGAKGYSYERIANPAMGALMRYAWPGNVRELDNVLERAMIVGNGTAVELADLDGAFELSPPENENLRAARQVFERQHIEKILARAGGDKEMCARRLGISRSSLFEKLTRFSR